MKNHKQHIPPGYKLTKVGVIPEEWHSSTLKHLCNKIMVGIATEVRPYVTEEGTPIIRNQNIRRGYFDSSDVIFISPEFDKANKNKRVYADDVIITDF